ncbi:MAG: metal-sulfur cluster assembly factor [Candidatus Bruticola sp.]
MTLDKEDMQPLLQAQCFPYNPDDIEPSQESAENRASVTAEKPDQVPIATDKNQNVSEEVDAPFPTEAQVREALSEVNDPEIGMSIIELGLVYDIIMDHEQRSVTINMTLTSPGCPLGPEITSAAYLAITRIKGVKDCRVNLVWTPMWDPETHPTEEARAALGFW